MSFPRWKPAQEFGNRYDWQQKPVYNVLMTAPHQAMVAAGLECEMERYAEVKAIIEGETSITGSPQLACDQGLTRNLDYDPELGGNLGKIVYNVFPLQMSEAGTGRRQVCARWPSARRVAHPSCRGLAQGCSSRARVHHAQGSGPAAAGRVPDSRRGN